MVVLGTMQEYFNAVWVKNEWSRYLELINSGAKKILIPAYRDMDPYNLPVEFSNLQALDMGKLGFVQDLVRGIKKVIGSPESEKSSSSSVSDNERNLMMRIEMFISDKDFDTADEYCSKVLDLNPKNTMVYLYKILIDFKKGVEKSPYANRLEQALPEIDSREKAFITEENKVDLALAFIHSGAVMRLKYLLGRFPDLLKYNVPDKRNPEMILFNYAICYAPKEISVIKVLLEAGADPNSCRLFKDAEENTKYSALGNA